MSSDRASFTCHILLSNAVMTSPMHESLPPEDSSIAIPIASLQCTDSRKLEEQDKIDLYQGKILRVGRDERINDHIIGADDESPVSRAQCEFYVVVYEPEVNHVFVRDRKSCNGTYVNGIKIGSAPHVSSGYLLQDGDVVRVPPFWSFELMQSNYPQVEELTPNQMFECEFFAQKYTIKDRCLGKGGEAAVYLAENAKTRQQLVCKMIPLDQVSTIKTLDWRVRKQHEIRVLRKLQHPNILPYVDAVVSPRTLYLFTELAAGGDLMSLINDRSEMSEFEAKVIVRQIVRGLVYLHRRGIIHRDLKPENVLLAYSPKIAYHRVMLADFGASALPMRNRMITNVGTLGYHAPEQCRRGEIQTPAVDMWSLGIITLHLLFPYLNRDPEELKELDEDGINIALMRDFFKGSKVSAAGKEFAWRCLRPDPEERITANEAEHCGWFSASEKETRFFRKFDQMVDTDKNISKGDRPLPTEIKSSGDSIY